MALDNRWAGVCPGLPAARPQFRRGSAVPALSLRRPPSLRMSPARARLDKLERDHPQHPSRAGAL